MVWIDTGSQASLSRVALPDDAAAGSLTEAFAARARTLDGVRYWSCFSGVDLVPATLAFEAVIQNLIEWDASPLLVLASALALPLGILGLSRCLGASARLR